MRSGPLPVVLVVLAALSGCAATSSSTTIAGARGPVPPSGSYLPPPELPAVRVTEPDPVVEAAARTRVLAIGDEWPTVAGWDGTPPVDRGDGVLRVRPVERCWTPAYDDRCRQPRWVDACAVPAPTWRGRQRGWRGARPW